MLLKGVKICLFFFFVLSLMLSIYVMYCLDGLCRVLFLHFYSFDLFGCFDCPCRTLGGSKSF